MATVTSALKSMADAWRVVIDAQPEGLHSSARLLEFAARTFEAWSPASHFTFLGDAPRIASSDFDDLIARRRKDWADNNPAPIVASDDPVTPSTLAVLELADLFGRKFDRVWIGPPVSDGKRSGRELASLLTEFSSIPRLVSASVQNELLSSFFFARKSAARALRDTPEHLHAYLPPAIIPDWDLPEPDLLLPDGRLPIRIPEAFWSANLFGEEQVESLGRQALLSADWVMVEPLPSGAILALATTEPPRSMTEETAAHILHIVAQLDLPTLQRSATSLQDGT